MIDYLAEDLERQIEKVLLARVVVSVRVVVVVLERALLVLESHVLEAVVVVVITV